MKKYSIAIIIFIVLIGISLILLLTGNNQENSNENNNGNNDTIVEANAIALNKIALTLFEGESEIIEATIIPANATDKRIIWESSDNAVVTVDNGKVAAIKAGSAIITAKTTNGRIATCEVLVKSPIIEVDNITLNKSSTSINVGESDTLIATINPTDATDKTITWTSSDQSIATVDSNGKVVGIKKGTTIITATSNNNKTASCTVTVKQINYEFSCSGKVDTDGTTVEVTGDNLDVIKSYQWNLNGKEVDGKNIYQDAKKGYTKITVTLTLNDGREKKVKCSIKDKLPYHFEENNGSPLYASGYCGKITDAENDKLNSQLNSIIDKVGRGTRAGVVEAGRFLMGNIPYIIAYQGTGGNNIYTPGLH
ncbi:MAG: Ig domain-containing protein, partial [Bacilli bacterium]|nr:Ig domain-containing protein [Bacilli bacterium]